VSVNVHVPTTYTMKFMPYSGVNVKTQAQNIPITDIYVVPPKGYRCMGGNCHDYLYILFNQSEFTNYMNSNPNGIVICIKIVEGTSTVYTACKIIAPTGSGSYGVFFYDFQNMKIMRSCGQNGMDTDSGVMMNYCRCVNCPCRNKYVVIRFALTSCINGQEKEYSLPWQPKDLQNINIYVIAEASSPPASGTS